MTFRSDFFRKVREVAEKKKKNVRNFIRYFEE